MSGKRIDSVKRSADCRANDVGQLNVGKAHLLFFFFQQVGSHK